MIQTETPVSQAIQLKMGKGNAKLPATTATYANPAGFSCPSAKDCRASANADTGHITDGPHMKFRCFSASEEAAFKNTRDAHRYNMNALHAARSVGRQADLIVRSLPKGIDKVRVHTSGDFFNQTNFDAWMEAGRMRPDLLFYAYTKSLPFWVARLNDIPDNWVLTASRGGHYDDLIDAHNLREVVVVFHPDEAKALGLECDHDDSHAYDKSLHKFALLLHGQQQKGSAAAGAIKQMKDEGIEFSYPSKKK